MRNFFLFFFISIFKLSYSQVETKLIDKTSIVTDNFIGCDYNFDYYYFTKTILTKHTGTQDLNYSNFLYGNITSVDITNPLKIVVFYREFNVVILLDSQLNEIDILQLPYDITYVSKGAADHIWLFTTNTKTIENFNFKNNTITAKSQPLKNTVVINMKSTENYVFLHTVKGIQTYDYMGNFISEKTKTSIEDFQYHNRELYTLSRDTIINTNQDASTITFPELSNIKKFYTLNNHFFIFDGTELYHFSTDKK